MLTFRVFLIAFFLCVFTHRHFHNMHVDAIKQLAEVSFFYHLSPRDHQAQHSCLYPLNHLTYPLREL